MAVAARVVAIGGGGEATTTIAWAAVGPGVSLVGYSPTRKSPLRTRTGAFCGFVVPSPTWPRLLNPQAAKEPSVQRARLYEPLATISVTVLPARAPS